MARGPCIIIVIMISKERHEHTSPAKLGLVLPAFGCVPHGSCSSVGSCRGGATGRRTRVDHRKLCHGELRSHIYMMAPRASMPLAASAAWSPLRAAPVAEAAMFCASSGTLRSLGTRADLQSLLVLIGICPARSRGGVARI